MAYISEDTIAAISTGAGSGAISIVRMSGKDSVKIADKIFKSLAGNVPSTFTPRMLTLGTITCENFNEQAFCVTFAEPKSYTGENMVEFQCHGGVQVATGVLKALIKNGARLASNGEFSKRAFLNGKLSLAAAEGIMDMINAESDAEVRAGYNLLSGNLSKLGSNAQIELTDMLAEIEVSFDYPEETIEYITKNNISKRLDALINQFEDVLATCHTGSLLKSGITTLIVGRPNVGKSSLLNFLLGTERAIVTDVAGTTRDTVEGTFLLGDYKINLIDTAGIQETADKVEKIGIDKAKSLISSADIVLFLVDSSRPYTAEDESIFESIKDTNYIVVKTKSDLSDVCDKHFVGEIEISTTTGKNVDKLKSKISELTLGSNIDASKIIITNERHKEALANALNSLKRAKEGLGELTLDLVSADIKDAYIAVGEITGNTASEDIIDTIFKKFCLGK